MFSVLQCNRLRPLAEHLLAEMAQDPLPPLEAEVIVVAQNKGLRGWLTGALALESGCAASLAMLSPREECLRLARALLPGPAGARREEEALPRDPFHVDALAWRVAAFLEAVPEEERYAPLRSYLAEGAERRWPLARRIAERFSDYQVYRPRLLAAWAAGERPHAGHRHAAWQAPLWQRLVNQSERPSRARQLLALQDMLEGAEAQEEVPAGRLPARLSVFGAGLLPPLYLDVLAALARHVPVCLYLVASRAAGGAPETEESHALHRLGRQRRVFAGLLRKRAGAWETLPAEPPPGDTMLGALQADLRAGKEPGSEKRQEHEAVEIAPGDRSLCIHSCHSPRRELEVLRDQLLDAFEALPDLCPEDVLVAVPDLERYAPLIETTFEAETAAQTPGSAAGRNVRLPIHIVSAQHGEEERVFEAMAALLALPGSRHTAAEVMELLDYPALRRAAGLAPEEVPVARRWVREAGVRGGHSGGGSKGAAPDAGTWDAGLDRLLLGYVMGGTDALVEGRLPYAEANAGRARLLGRLAAWLRRLFAFAREARSARPLAAWGAYMGEVIPDLLAPDAVAEHDAVQHLAEAAHDLEEAGALRPGAGEARAPFAAVRAHFQQATRHYEAHAEHVTGRVTFVSPMALRFAPYRVVAFLGLSDAFPPPARRPAYDLLAAAPRPSDHDGEREGEQLFYDALQAAGDRLILSYVGRSERDNAERAPSVVLEALLEACEERFAVEGTEGERAVRERLVTEHPLQPFNPAYFTGDDGKSNGALFSYSHAHCVQPRARRRARPFVEKGAALPADEEETGAPVRLEALQRAWAHPARFFCTRVLGVRLEGEAALSAEEDVHPGGLVAYQVREETLRLALGGAPPETWASRLEASGTLPPGALGEAWYERERAAAEAVARTVEAQGERQPRRLQAEGGSEESSNAWRVDGRLGHVTETCALAFRCATPKAKDLARAWPAHLLLCATARPRPTLVIGTGEQAWRLAPLEAEAARRQLWRLVRGYRSIRQAPPPFWPETSLAYAETKSRYKAESAFYDGWHPGEESDPYVQLCTRGRDPLAEDFDLFGRWAKAFWDPLLERREEVRL